MDWEEFLDIWLLVILIACAIGGLALIIGLLVIYTPKLLIEIVIFILITLLITVIIYKGKN